MAAMKGLPAKLAAAIAAADARDGRCKAAQVDPPAPRAAGQGDLVCQFRIEGEPVAWARARLATTDAGPQFVTAKPQRQHGRFIHQLGALAMRGRPPADGAVAVAVMVWRSMPKRFTKAQRADAAAGRLRPTQKPDADNFAKLVKDALNGVAWVDDAQVVDLMVRKFYTTAEPCTDVTVRLA